MIRNPELFRDGSLKLVEQRKVYKEMINIAKAAKDETNIDVPTLMRLKDYIHYYRNDWIDNDPFIVDKEAEYKDRLVQPFRRVLSVIEDLKKTGSLSMIQPVIDRLAERGITLQINDDVNFDNSSVMSFINVMDNYQGTICELADERKEFRDRSKLANDSTPASYNKYVSTYASYLEKKEQNKDVSKLEDKLQNFFLENSIDKEVFDKLRGDVE